MQAHCVHSDLPNSLLNFANVQRCTFNSHAALLLTQKKALKKSPSSSVSSVAFWQRGGGMNTDGSRIPRMMLKKLKQSDKSGLVYLAYTQWNR